METKYKVRKNYDKHKRYTQKLPPEDEIPRTKQQFKDECDIKNIMKKFETTGQLPDMIREDPKFGDFSSSTTYQEALNIIMHGETQFENLDAHVRKRFDNDPKKFLEFMNDQDNLEEIVDMGLAVPTPHQNVKNKNYDPSIKTSTSKAKKETEDSSDDKK